MSSMKIFLSGLFRKRAANTTIVSYTASSRIGARKNNQDNLRAGSRLPYICRSRRFTHKKVIHIRDTELFCVCDGIGGGYRGDLASKYALKAINRFMKTEKARNLSLRDTVLEAAQWAQDEVCAFYRTIQKIGGCTLVMVAIRGDAYAFLNIGDSPGFLLPVDGNIRELSQCHNDACYKLRMGLTPNPWDKNRLQRFLGMDVTSIESIAYITEGHLKAGDCLLLCSDGVTNAYSLSSLEEAMGSGVTAGNITEIASCEERADNCTAVCLKIQKILLCTNPDSLENEYEDSAAPSETSQTGEEDNDTKTERSIGAGDHQV